MLPLLYYIKDNDITQKGRSLLELEEVKEIAKLFFVKTFQLRHLDFFVSQRN